MIFPNTRVRFRFFDKLRLGATAGGGLGLGLFGAAGKIALLATNPIAALGALVGLGGIAFRQSVNFMNQKQRYMVVMAQNLYFHAMADNRGVMLKLAARAAEEDIKEEMLLYSVLTKESARRQDIPDIDAAIEQYLAASFGVSVDFDISDALERLIADGLVVEHPDGRLEAMQPKEAALHIDTEVGRLPRRAAGARQRRGHGVRRRRAALVSAARREALLPLGSRGAILQHDQHQAFRAHDRPRRGAGDFRRAGEAAEPALDAVTLFEDGAGAWRVEAYVAEPRRRAGRRRGAAGRERPPDRQRRAGRPARPQLGGDLAGGAAAGASPAASSCTAATTADASRTARAPSSSMPAKPSARRITRTTLGCLLAIDKLARTGRFRRVLDLGCGSGVLAIAAARACTARRSSPPIPIRIAVEVGARQRRRQRRPPHRHRLRARPRPSVAAARGALRPDHRQHPRRAAARAGRRRLQLAAPRRQRRPLRHPQSGGAGRDRRLRRPRVSSSSSTAASANGRR